MDSAKAKHNKLLKIELTTKDIDLKVFIAQARCGYRAYNPCSLYARERLAGKVNPLLGYCQKKLEAQDE
jgi:hypothetical protein